MLFMYRLCEQFLSPHLLQLHVDQFEISERFIGLESKVLFFTKKTVLFFFNIDDGGGNEIMFWVEN